MALTPDTDQFSQFLRLAFFRSPNYVAGVSGWTINQDGSVEFNNGVFRGVLEAGSLFIYVGTPGPGNLPVGSVTESTTDRYGNAVVPGVVAYVTISTAGSAGRWAVKLADTVSPPVGGTFAALTMQNLTHPFTGAPGVLAKGTAAGGAALDVVSGQSGAASVQSDIELQDSTFSGITGGLIVAYAGEYTFNTLIAAHTYAAALQVLNDATPIGYVLVDNYMVFQDQSSTPPANVSGPALWADASGFLRTKAVSSSSDTTPYQVGEAVYSNSSAQTISSTTPAIITGLTSAVDAGAYYFRGIFRLKQGATNVNQNVGFGGPLTSAVVWFYSDGGQGATTTSQKILVTSLSLAVIGFAAASDEQYVEFEGTVTFSASGTLNCLASEGTAGDTFTIQPGSIFVIRPTQ